MINVAVNDLERSRRFYEELLNVEFAEERHGDGPLHLNTTLGEWNTPSWFLLALWPDSDRAGTVDIGFLVDDLDQAYERALAAGATDVHGPPRDSRCREPRSSTTQAGTTSASTKPDRRRPQRWTRSQWERRRRTPQVAFLTGASSFR
jgi:catechol 2,3-dioxygenase-like lactoylglutathione lyase family enzyme